MAAPSLRRLAARIPLPPFGLRSLGRRAGVHPVEVAAWGGALLTFGFLRLNGLRYGWNTLAYQAPSLLWTIAILMPLGIAARALLSWPLGESPLAYLRTVASRRWIVSALRIWSTMLALPYLYTWLKVSIPLLRADLYDAEVWAIDRWLHGGVAPVVFAIELVAGTPVAAWMDRFYALWIYVVPATMALGFAARRSDVARNFAMANVLLWGIGVWIYYLLPVVGPCYFSPDVLEPIRSQIPRAVHTQDVLWSNYLTMVRSRGSFLGGFSPFYGVAAVPSLHVGAYAMYAFWARRHAPRLVLLPATATALIFLGSLVTAWHYAIDGYLAILLAWGAVRLADWWQPVEPEAPEARRPEAEPLTAAPEGSR